MFFFHICFGLHKTAFVLTMSQSEWLKQRHLERRNPIKKPSGNMTQDGAEWKWLAFKKSENQVNTGSDKLQRMTSYDLCWFN